MNLAQEFNSLNGIVVHRKDLENLLMKAEKEKHTVISKRIKKVLHAFADDTFLIEIKNLVEPYGLNGKQHTGLEKEALDDCGRLTKGHKYVSGKVVKTVSNSQKKTKKKVKNTVAKTKTVVNKVIKAVAKVQEKTKAPVKKPIAKIKTPITLKTFEDLAKNSTSSDDFRRKVYETKPVPESVSDEFRKKFGGKMLSIAVACETFFDLHNKPKNTGSQYALFGAAKKGLNAPRVEKETIAKEKTAVSPKISQNKNSLAYRLANKKQNHEFYKIQDRDIAEFLGEIEQKEKESVVITLAGGQGSMKTRNLFQLMNAFAQKYKCGHASLEEHPESVLYENKALEYLNETALQNVSAPEIENLTQLDQIIRENEVIFIDSFAKLKKMDSKFDLDTDLRKKYNGKLFIIIFQLTTDGKMRGGSTSQFDGDIILFTEKLPDYRDNYIYADKNRYQNKPLDGLKFNIFSKKLVQDKTEEVAEPTTKKKLSFTVN
ncbi:hypothetical protein [Flavobacterium sp. ZB4P13]|uniref:hypothetical protein n=1 Tax=Flavobacterium sp. ZB4P13 TaxID=3401728 RepID=UPI003AB044B9